MIWTIVIKELQDHTKSMRFFAGWLMILILSLVSVFLISGEYNSRMENLEAGKKMQEEAVAEYAHLNRIGFFVTPMRPLEKSEILFRGLNDPREETYFFVDVLNKVFPAFDMMFIITIMLSLLSIIFTYDSVCGERENGTLKLIHTSTLPRWKLLTGKLVGAIFAIAIPTTFVILLVALIGSVLTATSLGVEFLAMLLVILVTSYLYIAFFCSLGILVSTIARRSGASILVLLFLWVIFVLAIPNASPIVASQASPLPSVAKVEKEINIIQNRERDNRIRDEIIEPMRAFLTKYDLTEPDVEGSFPKAGKLTDYTFYMEQGIGEERAKELQREFSEIYEGEIDRINAEQRVKVNQIFDEMERKIDHQKNLAIAISYLSPTSSMTYLTTDLAALGLRAEEQFSENVQRYRESFWEWANQRAEAISEEKGVTVGFNEKIDLSGWPRFQHEPESVGDRLLHAGFNLVHLLIFMLITFLFSVFMYQRYDIR
jgi:ABC-type transport system involved in multi-copper enzyme maturation permease subunit